MKKYLLALAVNTVFTSLLAQSNLLHAATLRVPEDYPTIQAAVAAAAGSDVVEVAPGTYEGDGNRDVDLLGKEIAVRSRAGAEQTVLDCGERRAFVLTSGETPRTRIAGFTIRNGGNGDRGDIENGGGIYCLRSSVTISDCVFERCLANYGGALYVREPSEPAVVEHSVFYANHAPTLNTRPPRIGVGGAIYFGGGGNIDQVIRIMGCQFQGNSGWFTAM